MNFFFTGKIEGMDLNLVMALTWDHGVRMTLQQTHHQILAAMEGLPGNLNFYILSSVFIRPYFISGKSFLLNLL